MVDRHAQGDAGAQRIAHDIGPLVPEIADEFGDIGRKRFPTHRPVEGQRMAVCLELHADHLPAFGQRREHRAEHLCRLQPAMEKDERLTRPIDGVIDFDAVDRGVAGLGRCGQHCLALHGRRCGLGENGRAKSESGGGNGAEQGFAHGILLWNVACQ